MFISRIYRPDKRWPWYTLLVLEFPMTVALLTLFGIADPNTYRTKLWADGAENGFNSSPNLGLYAAANYRPYETPGVWSQFITSYNLVISVLSTFIMIAKIPMFILHCFPPLLSAFTHGALVALYAVSIHYQAGSDMSDPKHPQPGAPWYIAKPCSVAKHETNIHYCQQAKSAFACSVIITVLFAAQTVWSLYSLYPSKAVRELHSEKASRAKSAYAEAAALSPAPSTAHRSLFPTSLRSPRGNETNWGKEAAAPHGGLAQPKGFGGMVPMTPRTQAFNRLGGTRDLPLRNHFSSPNAPRSPTFGVKSPLATTFESIVDIEKANPQPVHHNNDGVPNPTSPSPTPAPNQQVHQPLLNPNISNNSTTPSAVQRSISPDPGASGPVGDRGRGPMYFPPPPTAADKRKARK